MRPVALRPYLLLPELPEIPEELLDPVVSDEDEPLVPLDELPRPLLEEPPRPLLELEEESLLLLELPGELDPPLELDPEDWA